MSDQKKQDIDLDEYMADDNAEESYFEDILDQELPEVVMPSDSDAGEHHHHHSGSHHGKHHHHHKKKLSAKKIALIVAVALFAVVLLAAGVVLALFHRYYSKLNYDDGDGSVVFVTTELTPDNVDENDNVVAVTDPVTGEVTFERATPTDASSDNSSASSSDAVSGVVTDDEGRELTVEEIQAEIDRIVNDDSLMHASSSNVKNILLVGQDSRDRNTIGRSDSMILLSINENTKQISMISLMRDMYVYIDGMGYTKLNYAYAAGGPSKLIKTIESNLKIKIDNYVAVSFYTFMDAVDAIGGVTVTVTEDELPFLNDGYLKELNALTGAPKGTDYLPGAGTYNLNGKQALAYCRIRYVGTETGRTAKQRRVINQIINKMKGSSLSEIDGVICAILPSTVTNISEGEMLSLAASYVTKYRNYSVREYQIPYEGSYHSATIDKLFFWIFDRTANIEYLQDAVYGK